MTDASPSLLMSLLSGERDFDSLADPAVWRRAQKQAAKVGLSNLFAWHARRSAPAEERAWCHQMLRTGTNCHETGLRHVEDVAHWFAEMQLPVVFLKGPLLAERAYTPGSTRKPSRTVELAVRAADEGGARALLAAHGYDAELLTHPTRPAVQLVSRLQYGSFAVPADFFFVNPRGVRLPDGSYTNVPGQAAELFQLIFETAVPQPGSHLYELRRLWRGTDLAVRAEVLSIARAYRVTGFFRVADVAYRDVWKESLFDLTSPVPGTWLGPLVNGALRRHLRRPSARLAPRWTQFCLAANPWQAVRMLVGRRSASAFV